MKDTTQTTPDTWQCTKHPGCYHGTKSPCPRCVTEGLKSKTTNADHQRSTAKEVMLGDTTIANICDAFLDGFQNAYRDQPVPYRLESGEHTAYLYGRALGGNQ